jgi:tRNA(Arg) A34 adenosine deaminase TadA
VADVCLDEADARHLREAIALSVVARDAGDMPYGAVLVGRDGRLLARHRNTQVTESDCTGHAETNLVREATRTLGAAAVAGSTVYASGEPCALCAGAMYWAGVSRVVYALSGETMEALGEPGDALLRISCREVMARGTRAVEVVGPALQAEARAVFGR